MASKNEIGDLRDHLFKQLDRLNDPDCDIEKEVKRSDALVNVGNVIVNSAKAEVDFMRVTKSKGSGFIPELPQGNEPKQLGDGK